MFRDFALKSKKRLRVVDRLPRQNFVRETDFRLELVPRVQHVAEPLEEFPLIRGMHRADRPSQMILEIPAGVLIPPPRGLPVGILGRMQQQPRIFNRPRGQNERAALDPLLLPIPPCHANRCQSAPSSAETDRAVPGKN